jgi:cytochrome c-type biogenesis protein CcmE
VNARAKRRLTLVAVIVLGVGTAAGLSLYALTDTLVFFRPPSELVARAGELTGRATRLGGLVETGSLTRAGVTVRFRVTDGAATIPVVYTGPLPDLFREGQGVVAEGQLDPGGFFTARTLLAKHDESYRPPEVTEALKRAGHPGKE